MRSWKTSASESLFSVKVPSLDTQHGPTPIPGTSASRSALQRNTKPCGRCSEKQKKCDVSPPYSPTRCGACTKANIPVCPPHKSRRLNNLRQATRRIFSSEQSYSTSSGPDASQSQPTGIDTGLSQYQTKDDMEGETAPLFLEVGLGLDRTGVLMTSQADNSNLYNFDPSVLDDGLDSSLSLQPSNDFLSQPETLYNDASFDFSTTFIPAFLPSL